VNEEFVNNTIIILVVIAVTFAIMWYTGQLVRLSNYVAETREELKKCTWPTWAELKGSTVVVFISLAILGVFTMAVDFVFAFLVRKIN
jgi:preprotein translocase subunit SecE